MVMVMVDHEDLSDLITRVQVYERLLSYSEVDLYERLAAFALAVAAREQSVSPKLLQRSESMPPGKRWQFLRSFLPPEALRTLAGKMQARHEALQIDRAS